MEKQRMDSSPGQRASTQSDVYPAGFVKKNSCIGISTVFTWSSPVWFFPEPEDLKKKLRRSKRNQIRVGSCSEEKSDVAYVRPLRKGPLALLSTVDNSYEAM